MTSVFKPSESVKLTELDEVFHCSLLFQIVRRVFISISCNLRIVEHKQRGFFPCLVIFGGEGRLVLLVA